MSAQARITLKSTFPGDLCSYFRQIRLAWRRISVLRGWHYSTTSFTSSFFAHFGHALVELHTNTFPHSGHLFCWSRISQCGFGAALSYPNSLIMLPPFID